MSHSGKLASVWVYFAVRVDFRQFASFNLKQLFKNDVFSICRNCRNLAFVRFILFLSLSLSLLLV